MKCGATAVARKWCEVSNMVDIEMIDEEEAMRMIRVSSRVTIRKYTERYNFPKPVRTYPKQYLRSAIVEWILNGESTRNLPDMPEYLFSIQIVGVFLFGNPVMLVIDRKHATKLMPQHFSMTCGATPSSDSRVAKVRRKSCEVNSPNPNESLILLRNLFAPEIVIGLFRSSPGKSISPYVISAFSANHLPRRKLGA